ncbi:MAG TPA: hypothetical protein VK588_07475 [Chitinophagaceae bacterium]|nr:hypothetical protein [Chitinophagaceae bacterium]
MSHSHPSESQIQEYALDKSNCTTEDIVHIESCAECSADVKTYLLLFTKIVEQPTPVFEFDLSTLVVSQLEHANPRLSADHFVAGFLVIFSSCSIGIPLFIFRNNILYMFNDVPPFFIYSILGSTSVIVIAKILLMFKKYQNQIRLLNFK